MIYLLISPGMSLAESNRVATQAELMILEVLEVVYTARRNGSAELDEHAENVNSSKIDVRLEEDRLRKEGFGYTFLRHIPLLSGLGWERQGRSQTTIEQDIQDRLSVFPGVSVTVGQPISHRLDHVLSGVRAQVAAKLFGP